VDGTYLFMGPLGISLPAGRLRALYDELDRGIYAVLAAHPHSACRACGICCTFPEGVPVLYATAVEHAFLSSEPPEPQDGLVEGRCPYVESDTQLCAARERRPSVCRTHFCDAAVVPRPAREAMQDLYDWAQVELRTISEAHGFAWEYVAVTD
jgi:hypothetical protein